MYPLSKRIVLMIGLLLCSRCESQFDLGTRSFNTSSSVTTNVTFAGQHCYLIAGSVHTVTCTLSAAMTAGDYVIVQASVYDLSGGTPTLTTTDTGATVTTLVGATAYASNGTAMLFGITSTSSGTWSYTFGCPLTCDFPGIKVAVLHKTTGGTPTLDVASILGVTVSSGTFACSSDTTAGAAEFVFSAADMAGSTSLTAGSGFTILDGSGTNEASQYGIFASSGTNSATWTTSTTSGGANCTQAAFLN